MKVNLQSTSKIITFNGLPARIWEGHTESGIKVHCYITRLACDIDEPRNKEFEEELGAPHPPPSLEVEAIPLRMII